MTRDRTFLLEVGCEEIPAACLPAALDDLQARLLDALGGPEGLGGRAVSPAPLGGPRRLTALVNAVRPREEDRVIQVTGPPVSAAFDPQGRPTKAALGFARAQGVDVEDLIRVKGDKGQVVAARRAVAGRSASEVLAQACPAILKAMRFPKMMRWGNRGYSFVRPVHWIVALLDEDVVAFEFLGVRSGRETWGHRFLSPGPHTIPSARQYEQVLAERGRVFAGVAARRDRIAGERDRIASQMGWVSREDTALLEELTFLSEHPSVIAGTFPREFLAIPEAVIVTAMRHHQKYFPVEEGAGRLAPGFLAVINQEGDPTGAIRRGNEWVLKARLSDARFFWEQDRKRRLEERVDDLARIGFHEKLGDLRSRSLRLEALAADLAGRLGVGATAREHARLAARLCKADLATGMVGEFPELQGVMGGIYARADGLPEPVARAIEEHYLPASLEGPAPSTPEASVVALADKLDLMAGCFAAGLLPSGSSDPYGLRRAAHGIGRILSPRGLFGQGLSLAEVWDECLRLYAAQGIVAPGAAAVGAQLREFLSQRLEFMLVGEGAGVDTVRAVLAAGSDDVRDAWLRCRSLSDLRAEERGAGGDFESLAAAAKRTRNILAQARDKGILKDAAKPDGSLLRDAEEVRLHQAIHRVQDGLERQVASGDYAAALRAIASLRPEVDRFFDKVLVMAPEPALRANRLALLSHLSALLSRVADFSEIVVAGETQENKA